MYNSAIKICPTCNDQFLPKSEKNIYCKRACFKKAHYHRKKAEELSNIKFPAFICPNCFQRVELDFDPLKQDNKWLNFCCPHCSVLMINVWEEIVTQDVRI